MTALPTLIRHTPGQKEPVLHFSHASPIDELIQLLQKSSAITIAASWRSVWKLIKT
jgi:hypothetical protein